jgi:hypothetical protein
VVGAHSTCYVSNVAAFVLSLSHTYISSWNLANNRDHLIVTVFKLFSLNSSHTSHICFHKCMNYKVTDLGCLLVEYSCLQVEELKRLYDVQCWGRVVYHHLYFIGVIEDGVLINQEITIIKIICILQHLIILINAPFPHFLFSLIVLSNFSISLTFNQCIRHNWSCFRWPSIRFITAICFIISRYYSSFIIMKRLCTVVVTVTSFAVLDTTSSDNNSNWSTHISTILNSNTQGKDENKKWGANDWITPIQRGWGAWSWDTSWNAVIKPVH